MIVSCIVQISVFKLLAINIKNKFLKSIDTGFLFKSFLLVPVTFNCNVTFRQCWFCHQNKSNSIILNCLLVYFNKL